MPSITPEEYWSEFWSPPRRKILRAVGVRSTKRDWAAPAEPLRTQKPQLLCARCGRTWEPRQYILRSGRLPKRCPHCASPRWNQPYQRKRRSEPSRILEWSTVPRRFAFTEFCKSKRNSRISERSTVPPKGGLAPPLSGAIAITAPAPLGAGEEREARAGSGGHSKVLLNIIYSYAR